MKSILLTLVSLLLIENAPAQAPEIAWTRVLGGSGDDIAYSVCECDQGGFVFVGCTDSLGPGGTDLWMVKTDSDGDTLWTRTFGGMEYSCGTSVEQTRDGGYIITGQKWEERIWLIKTDADGMAEWDGTYGGGVGNSVAQTSDGGFVVTGSSSSARMFLLRTDERGGTIWMKEYARSGAEALFYYNSVGTTVRPTLDGGYVIVGTDGDSFESPHQDIWAVRTDSDGDTLWTRIFATGSSDFGRSVVETSDGGVAVAGNAGVGLWLIRTDAAGDSVWTRNIPQVSPRSIRTTPDGGFIVAGYTGPLPIFPYGPEVDLWIGRFTAEGDTLWTTTTGGERRDGAFDIVRTSDGGYLAAGITVSDGPQGVDAYLIRLAPESSASAAEDPFATTGSFAPTSYPNPTRSVARILYETGETGSVSLRVYDRLGRLVRLQAEGFREADRHSLILNTDGLSSGVYLYTITTVGGRPQTGTVTIVR